MQNIFLNNLLPNVFMQRTDIVSDIWKSELTLEKGKTYLVEAGSGTGKSSLCSFIYGYRSDYQGNLFFDSDDVRSFDVNKWTDIRRKHIALLWQELRLFPELTAMENVEIKNTLTGFQKRKKIDEWFEMLGVGDKRDTLIGQMSFGQQQRVALIRALCQPFDFILVDEPVSHLDDDNGMLMGKILLDEVKRQGAGVIATSIGKRLDIAYDNVLRL